MPKVPNELIQQIEAYDREARSEEIEKTEETHQGIVDRFPLEGWETMPLETYALGQDQHPDSFCKAIEYEGIKLGGMGAGRASKHLIYYSKSDDAWRYDSALGKTEIEAWEAIRAGFLEMFDLAEQGQWEEIDHIEVLKQARVSRGKTLYMYFKEDLIPIFSPNHLLFYLRLLEHPAGEDHTGEVIRLNRELLKSLREVPGTASLTNHDLMVILYEWKRPNGEKENPYTLRSDQLEMLMGRFKETMTDFVDFSQPGAVLIEEELKPKQAVLDRFQKEGGKEKISSLVAEGQGREALKMLQRSLSAGKISIVNHLNWPKSFGDSDETICAVLHSFIQATKTPYERPTDLSLIFKTIQDQKLKTSWDTLSSTLWLFNQDDFFPVKIRNFKKLANELGEPLPKGIAGQNTFAKVYRFGQAFYDALEDYEPQGWLDVQSFIWTVCPLEKPQPSGYWVFQCNPKQFDLPDALNSTQPLNWNVNQHQDDIQKGDKVILWITGAKGGCYGLATVASDLYDQKDGFGDKKVDLAVDVNISKTPLSAKAAKVLTPLKDFKGGNQGTNLLATESQFEMMRQAAEILSEQRNYWLYSPGPQAVNWESNWEHGEMTLGWDGTNDLMSFSTKDALKKQLKDLKDKENPYNDTTALWEFSRDIRLGDVIVVKKGISKLLGYGIVTGEYAYDADRETYRHTRKVDWKTKGTWDTDSGGLIKTLTHITPYLDYVYRLKQKIGIPGLNDEETLMPPKNSMSPKNLILYGPPGTGKTYTLRNDWFPSYTTKRDIMTEAQLAEEVAGGRTWWEVIAMVVLDLEEAKVGKILEHPLMRARILNASAKNPRASIWSALQIHTQLDCPSVKYESRMEPLLFHKDEKSVWTIDEALTRELVPELLESLDKWKKGPSSGKDEHRFAFTTFHQSYTYEDFIEGIKPVLAVDGSAGELGYELKDGVFKNIAKRAQANPEERYALFIDEINRGNVASIFGELITLIEADKRGGMSQSLTATLPYSREEFSVPKNLDIIATMNTADRSVEALDTALRRRFEFKEMMPLTSPQVITPSEVESVDLCRLLETINARIECLLDRDHLIGHSYLIGLQSLQDLREAFANKILPLLQEYFYHDPARIGMVLGSDFVERKTNGSGSMTFGKGSWDVDGLEERDLFVLKDPMTLGAEAYKGVYEAEANS